MRSEQPNDVNAIGFTASPTVAGFTHKSQRPVTGA